MFSHLKTWNWIIRGIFVAMGVLCAWPIQAQSPPQMDAYRFRLLNVATGEALPLVELHSSVRVIGELAETTLDMTFSTKSQGGSITGQIDFRLPEGAAITRFGMDVGGVLREGVWVKKEKGVAATLESGTTKAGPGGILARIEETSGQQHFRARVFPIAPGGEKRVVIAWEEKMKYLDGDDFYACPLYFKDEVRLFTFEAIAENQPFVPTMKTHPLGPASFKRKGNAYRCQVEARSYVPDSPIEVLFPVNPPQAQLFFEPDGDSTWFHLRNFVGSPGNSEPYRSRNAPKRILLLWDVSFSGLLRDHAQELEFLDQYLSQVNSVEVEVATFADRMLERRIFEVKNRQWDSLHHFLENLAYDGASLPGTIALPAVKCDEILLFSDGMASYGPSRMLLPAAPVHAIASSPLAQSAQLAELCAKSGGKFLDLGRISIADALSQLSRDDFRFISAKFPRGKVSQLSPSFPSSCPAGFTMSGVFKGRATKLELSFGYGNRVTEKFKYELQRPESHKVTKGLARIWARKKLAELMVNPAGHESEIAQLGLDHQLITPFTSLVVLEAVEDYLKHEVQPPADLKKEFDRQMLLHREALIRAQLDSNATRVERLEEVLYDYMDRVDWYEAGRGKLPENVGWLPEERARFRSSADSLLRESRKKEKGRGMEEDTLPRVPLREGSLRGQVVDENGSPLPGAVVRIVGTDLGSYTDQEGRFVMRLDSAALASLSSDALLLAKAYRCADLQVRLADLREPVVLKMQEIEFIVPSQSKDEPASFPGLEALVPQKSAIAWLQPDSNYLALPEGMVYVLDGVVQDTFPLIRRREVTRVEMLRSDRVLFRYGLRGLNGMYFIFRSQLEGEEREQIFKTSLELPTWDSSRPYLDSLKRLPSAERYLCYLRLRDAFGASPSYYAEAADYFIQTGRELEGLRILSNLAEFDLESPEPLRTLAFQLQILGRDREALPVLQRIWREFPNEPQSWRDLALAYAQLGQQQAAVDLLHRMLQKDWTAVSDLYQGIEQTALAELNALLAHPKSSLKTDHIDQRIVYRMPVPLRITVDWNRFETDVDLYLVTPAGDTLDLTSQTKSSFLGTDMVDGYGPEEILLLDAPAGAYKLLIDYYDDAKRNEIGPTLLKINVFQNFGEASQQARTYGVRLGRKVKGREVLRFRCN